jgi:hypothetical protein
LVIGGFLQDVPGRTGAERLAGEGRVVLHGQDDDPRFRGRRQQLRNSGEARSAWHVEVEDEDRRTVGPDLPQRFVDIACLSHDLDVRLGLEHHLEAASDDCVIVGDDYLRLAFRDLLRLGGTGHEPEG